MGDDLHKEWRGVKKSIDHYQRNLPPEPEPVEEPPDTRPEKGDPGVSGPLNSFQHNGQGAPTAAMGNIGDMYLDLAKQMMYGPKTSNGWGPGVSMQGAVSAAKQSSVVGATVASQIQGSSGIQSNLVTKQDLDKHNVEVAEHLKASVQALDRAEAHLKKSVRFLTFSFVILGFCAGVQIVPHFI